MKFEHLVQINTPDQPKTNWLTRDQLWIGLRTRAWKPTQFILGLEHADVVEFKQINDITTLHRKLHYGSFCVEDTVELHTGDRTKTTIRPSRLCGPSTLIIQIEEPEPDILYLRFQYQVIEAEGLSPTDQPTQDQDEMRKQAYKAADLDTVNTIRELALAQSTRPLE